MARKSKSTEDDLIFYVDEKGNDFTFFLSENGRDFALNAFSQNKLKERLDSDSKIEGGEREFSFLERIKIKTRLVTKDNFKDIVNRSSRKRIDHSFWKALSEPSRDPKYRYLLTQTEAEIKADQASGSQEDTRKARDAIKNLPRRVLNNDEKKTLLPFVAKALSATIDKDRQSPDWMEEIHLTDEERARFSGLRKRLRRTWENRLRIEKAFPGLIKDFESGRGLVCLSYSGESLSITLRKQKDGTGYAADMNVNRAKNLFSLHEYCQRINKEVFDRIKSGANGLLVITGSTNSAKSEIARGLIDCYLSKKPLERRRHLVTFEEPIEKLYAEFPSGQKRSLVALEMPTTIAGKDYTPREKGKDGGSLKDALMDALRQTPAVFFVGETREKQDWKLLLDFAGTGHLIVTTAHAGSLVEAMNKIFEACEVETPADRSEIASKLHGLIHLRAETLEVVPSLFEERDIKDVRKLVKQLKDNKRLVSIHLKDRFKKARPAFSIKSLKANPHKRQLAQLVKLINRVLSDRTLNEQEGFKKLQSSSLEAQRLLAVDPRSLDAIRLNRVLLEDAYPDAIAKRRITTSALFPSLWRRTPRGVAGLTSDGLASLLPHRPARNSSEDSTSCIGRRWFIERLIKSANTDLTQVFGGDDLGRPSDESKDNLTGQAYARATQWDLEGV